MPYSSLRILTKPVGNNAFAWDARMAKYGDSPTLTIPSLIEGGLDDVIVGDHIVFEEMEDGVLRSCLGLKHFVSIAPTITIFDNHNHALYFWIDAVRKGYITKGFELYHIDEHSDLWDNEHDLDLDRAIEDPEYAWDFTNLKCNVGNYILPAIESGLVNNVIRVENEYQIDTHMDALPHSNSVLNLDLDIFAPELDHIPVKKKLQIIRNLIPRMQYVTIATSPYFIDQGQALQILRKIFQSE